MASGLPMDHVPCKFDVVGDASNVSIRWEAWLEEFEAYADSRGLFNDKGKNRRNSIENGLWITYGSCTMQV